MKKRYSQTLIALLFTILFLSACDPVNAYVLPEEPDSRDEMKTESISDVVEQEPEFDVLVHERARDLAVAYAAAQADVDIPNSSWSTQDETPEELVGSTKFLYTNGPWVVQVSAPVVAPEYLTYSIVIDNLSAIFRWEGTVDAHGNITEISFVQGSLNPVPAPPTVAIAEQACDAVIAYLVNACGFSSPDMWTAQSVISEPGLNSQTFNSKTWVVKVSWPVSAPYAPYYQIVADQLTEVYHWRGKVRADGSITTSEETVQPSVCQNEKSWIGVVVANPPGSQFDDYFQMMDQNGNRSGIAGETDEINARLNAFRDSGQAIQVWGVQHRDVPDAYGMQIRVIRIELY